MLAVAQGKEFTKKAAGIQLGTRSFLGAGSFTRGETPFPFLPSSLGTPRACCLLALAKLPRTIGANPMPELSVGAAICFHALS